MQDLVVYQVQRTILVARTGFGDNQIDAQRSRGSRSGEGMIRLPEVLDAFRERTLRFFAAWNLIEQF